MLVVCLCVVVCVGCVCMGVKFVSVGLGVCP